MSFLDLYQGDQEQAARIQPNEGHDLPSGFDENFHAAWSDGRLFSQSIAQLNARGAALDDYADEVKSKTGFDLRNDLAPKEGGGPIDYDAVNFKIAALNQQNPSLNIAPLNDDEIDKRALVKAQAAHRNYQALQAGERTAGGAFGSFLGTAAATSADPINIAGLAIAPETAGIGILSAALRWGAVAGVSQATIEFASDDFKNQVQPGYTESGEPLKEIGGAFVGGAALGGITKALGSAWTKVKTGNWPTSVRDAGNVIESEAHTASTNPLPGAEGEVAHREALVKSIDDVLAGRPVDVGDQITPEMAAHIEAYHGSPHDFDAFDTSKIGTGEGAQAYGHGLYFAENPKVAEGYADRLGTSKISNDDLISGNYELGPNGNTYRVKITADKNQMLDLDRRLNEQAPQVQEAVRRAMGIDYHGNFYAAKSERLWSQFQNADGKTAVRQGFIASDDKLVAQRLSDAGIPGLKYLDDGSRAQGEGTRNFVVFNDKHVEITHKNGKPVNAEIRQGVIDQAAGLPPKEPELPLDTEPQGGPLIVARKMPDGSIRYGRPDQIHADLVDADASPLSVSDDQMGFARPGGPFMDRNEATKFLDDSHPDLSKRIDGRRDGPIRQIEAGQYNDAVKYERAQRSAKAEPGPQPMMQTSEQIAETMAAPDHQDVIRGDIDRAIDANAAEGKADIKVPGIDEMGNHTMVSVHSAVDEVDAYKKLATDIQACAVQQEAAE